MKRPQNAFDRLYAAANEIIRTARGVFADAGEPHPDRIALYMPVMISGTDLRIVIESGPSVAANNAIVKAMGKTGQPPALSFQEAVRRAADLIALHAASLREAHAPGGNWGEDETHEEFSQMLEVVDALNRGRW